MNEKVDLRKKKEDEIEFNKKNYDFEKKKDGKGRVIAALIVSIILIIAAGAIFINVFNRGKRGDTIIGISNISQLDGKTGDIIADMNLTEDEEEAKDAVSGFLSAVRNLDFDEAYKYSQNGECSMDFIVDQLKEEDKSIVQYNTFFKKMMDYSYEIDSIKAEGEKASAHIVIDTYNFTVKVVEARLSISDAQAAYSFENGDASDKKKKEIADDKLHKILDPMERKLKIPLEIELVKEDGQWKITTESIDDKIKIAVMKNLYDSIDSYTGFYEALNEGKINEISMDSFISYLEDNGVHYDEDSENSPFDN